MDPELHAVSIKAGPLDATRIKTDPEFRGLVKTLTDDYGEDSIEITEASDTNTGQAGQLLTFFPPENGVPNGVGDRDIENLLVYLEQNEIVFTAADEGVEMSWKPGLTSRRHRPTDSELTVILGADMFQRMRETVNDNDDLVVLLNRYFAPIEEYEVLGPAI